MFRAAGVGVIYLADGTFMGAEGVRILSRLARVFPAARSTLRRVIKRVAQRRGVAPGHYGKAFARWFEAAINPPGEPRVPVRVLQWSSENHHLGRADGAVRLIERLASLEPGRSRRVLLWGHGHAGNVFALATSLLAGDAQKAARFFKAAEVYYRWPLVGWVDVPVWERVRHCLSCRWRLPNVASLDIVTFGTPIRYGWEPAGYRRLLHFINHRPVEGLPDYLAPFPPDMDRVMAGAERDYVQQLGIAGTDVTPGALAWRARLADDRLGGLLEEDLAEEGLLARLKAGAIVPDRGTTLLVDYGLPAGGIGQQHAGHAVYTRREWLLFHAEEVARHFYAASVREAA